MTKNQSRALHVTKLHKSIQRRGNGVKYRSVTDIEQNGAVARSPRILEKAINYSLFRGSREKQSHEQKPDHQLFVDDGFLFALIIFLDISLQIMNY